MRNVALATERSRVALRGTVENFQDPRSAKTDEESGEVLGLYLQGPNFDDAFLRRLGGLPALRSLTLEHTTVTDLTLAQRRTGAGFQGSLGATTAYAAPEQLSGGELSVRTDIFGLGVLLDRILDPAAPLPAGLEMRVPDNGPRGGVSASRPTRQSRSCRHADNLLLRRAVSSGAAKRPPLNVILKFSAVP